MAKKNTDIKKTGPQSYRDLQQQNSQFLQSATDSPFINLKPSTPYISSIDTVYEGPEKSSLQLNNAGDYWGKSQYDNPTANEEEYQSDVLQDTRYENQSTWDVLANGVGKMLGTAGTTFLSSLVGVPVGIGTAISEGRLSGLWDNSVTQALGDVDKWMEENMANYKSTEQQNNKWWQNLGTATFWADDVIKNAGFTLGAAASMAVGSGSLGLLGKAFGLVNDVSKGTKIANGVASALFSATGEGMIEARQGVEERNKLEMKRLEDALAPEIQALELEKQQIQEDYALTKGQQTLIGPDGRPYDPAYQRYVDRMGELQQRGAELNQRMEAGKQQIEESGREMGNKILLGNQVLLTAGNLIQFGKAMTKSFDNARHAAELSSKYTKPFGVSAKRVGDSLKEGYEISGKGLGRTIAATKGLLTEGSEEMNQQWIQSSAGAAYNEKDVNDYWKAKLNDGSYREASKGLYTLGNILSQGFKESWGDADQWEQFVIGGLTGMAGSYSPTKLFNQDKTKSRWDPRRYGSWEGGAYNEIKDFNEKYNQYSENIDDLNKVLQQEDFFERMQSLTARAFTEGKKREAAENNNKRIWKDEDDKQNIHDIQAFLRAGKIDDLRAIYDEMGKNLSDEDVEGIIKANTREVSAEEDKQQHDAIIDEQIAERQRKIDDLQTELNDLQVAVEGSADEYAEEANMEYVRRYAPELNKKIATEEAAIAKLKQEKESYSGKSRFESPYLTEEGNRIKSNDAIREEIKHNSEELQRKLNSYLDSVAYVRARTGENLTKDQEDNLAYLHNLYTENVVRVDKIFSNRRKEMPTKFFLKTTKSPEQLAKENTSSDLVFNRDENTPEGYVEVDTSMMNGSAFGDFFVRDILWGNNLKANPKEPTEEEKKAAEEQEAINLTVLGNVFVNNHKKNRVTDADTERAFAQMAKDIIDASALVAHAEEYYNTLNEYMSNPQKVDEDKQKESEKATKKEAEKQAKDKFGGKTAKEIKQDIENGNTDFGDLDSFIKGADSGEVKAETKDVEAAKNAKKIIDKQNSLEGFIANNSNPTAVADARQMTQWLASSAENSDDISVEALQNFDADSLISEDEARYMAEQGYTDQQIHEQAEARKQQAMEAFGTGMEAWLADQDKEAVIPKTPEKPSSTDQKGTFNFDDTGHDGVTKSPSNIGNKEVPKAPVAPKEPVAVTEGEASAAIEAAKEEQDVTPTDNGGTWRNTTRRFGRARGKNGRYQNTSEPYHEIAKVKYGENSVEYKRSLAIFNFLNSDGVRAFDNVENASEDRIQPGDTIRFRAKSFAEEMFGKPFGELTDKEKRDSIVILMTDSKGSVLGDLPYPEFEPSMRAGKPTKDVTLLQELYTKVSNALISRQEKDGTTDIMVDGKEGLNLKYKNGKPLTGQIFEVKTGFVPYTEKGNVNTLNDIAGKNSSNNTVAPFTLAIKVLGNQINVGQKKPADALGPGKVGQCYMLIPDASGKQIPVPFATPVFNAEMKNTALWEMLKESLTQLERYPDPNTHKEERNRAIDVMCALLQIEKPFLEMDSADRMVLRFYKIGDKENRQKIEVSKAGDWKTQLLEYLAGTPIQVSLRYINDKISVGGLTKNYNEIIGEIAYTNLPENTRHTVGSWFTIRNLSEEGPQKTKITKYPEGETNNYIAESGRIVAITTGNVWSAADPKTGEIIEGDPEIDLMMAKMQAFNKDATDGFIMVDINGETKKYDVKNNKFVSINQPAPQKKEEGVDDFSALFGGFNPGTREEAKQKKQEAKTETKKEEEDKYKTLEEAEKAAKKLGIVSARTQHSWNALSEDLRKQLMNGQTIEITFNGTKKTLSVNSVQEIVKTLQEWNMSLKRNKDGLQAKPLLRKEDGKRKKADIQREKKWLQDNLPMFSSNERLNLIKGLIEIPGSEEWAWGRFEKGIITLSDVAARGTLYHEAFHAVTQTLLSDEELNSLYDAAVKHYKKNDVALVEELLAEDFRKYVQRGETPIIGPILKVFRRMLNAIRNISGYKAPIHELFYKINNGEFRDTLPRGARRENAFYSLAKNYYLDKNDPQIKYIIQDGIRRGLSGNNKEAIIGRWDRYVKHWREQGFTPVGHWDDKALKYNIYGVMYNNDYDKWKEENEIEAINKEIIRKKEVYQARQAREGRDHFLKWENLTPELQEYLINDGKDEKSWNNMSIQERDQYKDCHG